MLEPEEDEEPPVVILPLSGITATLSGASPGSNTSGISMAASNAKTHKLMMIAFFLFIVALSTFP
jgi:hypothetical protein